MKKLMKIAAVIVGLFVGIAVIAGIAGSGGGDSTTTAADTDTANAETEPTAEDTTEEEPASEPETEPADGATDDTIGGHDIPADEDLYLDSLDQTLVNSYSADELLTYGYAVCEEMEAMHADGNASDALSIDSIEAFADEHGLDSFDAGAIQGAAGSLCPSVSLQVSEDALDELDY